MRLQTKLILVFLFLGLVPVTASGYRVLEVMREYFIENRDPFVSNELAVLAQRLDENLEQAAESLRLGLESFELNQMEEQDRLQVQRLLFRQRPFLNGIQLLDSQGQAQSPMLYLSETSGNLDAFAGHVAMTSEEAEAFFDQKLVDEALTGTATVVWGVPRRVASGGEPQIPLVVVCKREGRTAFMAFAVMSLLQVARVERAFEQVVQSEKEATLGVFLVDAERNVLFQSPASDFGAELEQLPTMMDSGLRGSTRKVEVSLNGHQRLVYSQDLLNFDFSLLLLQDRDVVFKKQREGQGRLMLWTVVSIVIAVVFGVYFSRTLSTPIRELAAGVLDVARGNLDTRVTVTASDEIGELAETFNYMAGELRGQKAEIERQSEEIRSWNRELQARVDARTRELKEAQSYLIHSQKIAAVAELGSGVAHELNNPLAAVLGFTQILINRHSQPGPDGEPVDDPEIKILKRIEEQSQRCRDIVQNLLRFSQEQVDRGSYEVVDLAEVVSSVLQLFEGSFGSQRIHVSNRLKPGELVSIGNRAQLLQAFLQMLRAVRPLLAAGQELVVERIEGSQDVRLAFSGPMEGLSGPALDLFQKRQNQDQAMVQGLGLWLAHQIIQEHKGSLQVETAETTEGVEGARLVITLPRKGPPTDEGSGA